MEYHKYKEMPKIRANEVWKDWYKAKRILETSVQKSKKKREAIFPVLL